MIDIIEEYSAFCNALIVSLKWANKSPSEENQRILAASTEKIRQLQTYMSNSSEEKCCIL